MQEKRQRNRREKKEPTLLTRTDQQRIWSAADAVGFDKKRVEEICHSRFGCGVVHIPSTDVSRLIDDVETQATIELEERERIEAAKVAAEEARRAAESAAALEKERRVEAERQRIQDLRREWASSHRPGKKLRRKQKHQNL